MRNQPSDVFFCGRDIDGTRASWCDRIDGIGDLGMASGNRKHVKTETKTKVTVSELTEQERAALGRYSKRRKERSSVRLKLMRSDGAVTVGVDHPNESLRFALLMEAMGTADPDFMQGMVAQLANGGSERRAIDEASLNFMLSVIKGIAPKDHIETMLAAQMAAVHMQAMKFARRLDNVENIPQQDSAERALNKLTRTFATQMEALKRYRTGGEQKVTVQHVSVSEGGQAIVGNVTQAAAEKPPHVAPASPLAITDAKTAPMPMIDEHRATLPVPAHRRRVK